MTSKIRSAAAAAAMLAALAVPAGAFAATTTSAQTQSYTFPTTLTDRYHAGEYDGLLRLHISPGGIVQGTYQPSDGGIRSVTGGLDGKNIWLDIGGGIHALHVTGTFQNGVLRTTAALPGPDLYEFDSASVKPSR
ncbi:MAG TPA: hypothetical protein VHS78_08775 [Candidatus Elarobacter sp.]|jgi:hypothetical protein|nr:hypothetical protein [Candidatus Elarobacter sp.]